MSANLCKAFESSLNLNKESSSQIDLSLYSTLDQAQIQQWTTVSSRFPTTFPELNDALRETTFLLGGSEVSELDAFVLGRASPFLEKFSKDDVVNFRHIVRWTLLVQKIVGKTVLDVSVDTEAPRELPKKKEKKGGDTKESSGKDNKKAEKKGKDAASEAGAGAGAAGAAGAEKQGKKKEKKEKKPQPAAAPARAVTPGIISLKVGVIEKAVKHPDADSLYVSTINVGEEEPRTICSGLVKHIPIEDMQKAKIVVVANLKPVKMRGIASNGMVLCACTPDHEKVEFVKVPENAQPGDKLFFEGFDEEPEPVMNPKKKWWEQIQPNFTTDDDLAIVYKYDGKQSKLVTKGNEVLTSSTIKNAVVS